VVRVIAVGLRRSILFVLDVVGLGKSNRLLEEVAGSYLECGLRCKYEEADAPFE
jgi:hypothetical protein